MCGIAGYIGKNSITGDRQDACLGLMDRRGPDHQGRCEWVVPDGRHVYLLHSRLNIIDLDDRANQPFKVGSKVMAFNGEIYNYLEVKSALAAQGRNFYTASDTEVLLHAIDHSGIDGLDRCEGMWALAVYDQKDGSLMLSRDRFGEKPLYLLETDDGLYFGSEIKFIFGLLGHGLDVDFQQLYRYMVNGYKSLHKQAGSFYQGIRELPAAGVLIVGPGGQTEEGKYWSFEHKPNDALTYADAVEQTRELLIRSVELRLRSDVPIAFCLSGGVDSNALISIAKEVHGYDVHGFTIVDEDPRYNEMIMAQLAIDQHGLRHTQVPVDTRDFLSRLRTLTRQHDAPIYTITYFAHWLLMQSVSEHGYRISVSGTAADELFSGYYDHHQLYLHALRNDPDALALATKNWETHIKPIVRNPLLQDPRAFINNPEQREHIYFNADGFGEFLIDDWSEAFTENLYTDDLMRNRMLNELFHEAVPTTLHEEDMNAMYFSIENRSPFLDRNLFEFALTIPDRHLIQDGRAKAVLRDAVRGIAAEPIIDNRQKIGFNAPIHSFLDVKDKEVREYLLDDGPIFNYIRRDKIETLIDKASLPNSESKFLFYFVCAKMFLEECGR
jgi:asparagine synthase (glutamine-hydrolysing)